MNTEIYCGLRRTDIGVSDFTPGTVLQYGDCGFACGNAYPQNGVVLCLQNRQTCMPFQNVALKILNMPRETTESALAELAQSSPKVQSSCPAGSDEDIENWFGQA
jgi:hypothetical protein